MPAAPRRQRRAVLTVLLAVGLAACSAPAPAPEPAPSPLVTPTALPSPSATGRPVQPVPDVRPAGFTDPPAGSGLDRYRRQALRWRPCAKGVSCASVLAPLDYADPDGTAITLALAKRDATAPDRLGTLFVNPGGPGGSGRGYAAGFNAKGLERYDVVGWDPRGVGASTPVTCFGSAELDRYFSVDVSPDDAAEEQRLQAENYAFGTSCLARSGSLLEHISTAATVQDLDLLRGLVGDARLNYLGASYGTQIGALYAQTYPDHVGHLVLDGAVNISGDKVSQIEGFERALTHFAAWAATAAGRPLGAGQTEVLSRVRTLLTGLDGRPLPVGDRQLSQAQGVQGVVDPLYERDDWPRLLKALETAEKGNGRDLLELADAGNFRSSNGTYGQIVDAFPAIRCLDSQDTSVAAAEREAKRDGELAPLLGPLAGPDLVCPLWPVAPAPKEPKITATGARPIVVVGTTGDPATPYEDAVGMAHQLSSGVLVTLEGEGHTAYGQSSCIRGLVDAYLVQDQVPPDGVRCTS
ncbi:alpha/beta hydrolase [uncultured Friedmanniella sp.]|uniref:alpha/beta hydrolase n=1 Tax=uncultured Friedmanniella sp. TaxID=335381 RepID=UPI0035CC8D05